MPTDATPTTCPECGHEPGPGRFCRRCGARTTRDTSGSAGPATSRTHPATSRTRPATSRTRPGGPPEGDDVLLAHTPPPPARRASHPVLRVLAVLALVATVVVAAWLQRPDLRRPERAGGLATYGGSTSDTRAALGGIAWSRAVTSLPPPADVEHVVAHATTPLIVTDDAVWVLGADRRSVAAELPRLGGVPRPDEEGHLALLVTGALLRIHGASGDIVERRAVEGLTLSEPLWAAPTAAGYVALDTRDPAAALLVHAGAEGAWTVAGVDASPPLEADGVLVVSAGDGVRGHELDTGSIRWRIDGAALVGGARATAVARRPDGSAIGIDATSGSVLWRTDPADVPDIVGVVGDRLVGIADQATGRLVAVDVATGALEEFVMPTDETGAPLLGVRPLGEHLVATDGATAVVFRVGGDIAWRVADRVLLGLAGDGDLVAVTSADGTRVLDGRLGEPYLAALPRASRDRDPLRPAVADGRVLAASGLVLDLADGGVVRGPASASATADLFAVSEGGWEVRDGRSVVTDRDGTVRWQSSGGTVLRPVADTPRGVVAVLDDGALGSVRLVDPVTGVPRGTGVLDAAFRGVRPVAPDLVVGRWRDRITDEEATVAVTVRRDGLAERWRSPVTGDVVGLADDGVVLARPGELVVLDAATGAELRRVPVPVLSDEAALLGGHLVLLTDTGLVGVPLDGTAPWSTPLPGRPTTQPVVGGDRVHVGLADGRVVTIDGRGTVVDERDVGDTDVRSVVIAGDRLVVRTARRLVVIGG